MTFVFVLAMTDQPYPGQKGYRSIYSLIHMRALAVWTRISTLSSKSGLNSVVPGRCGSDFKSVISKHMPQIKLMSTSCKIALR